MQELLSNFVAGLPLPALIGLIAFFICTLAKGAGLLVDEAVTLSARWGVPKMLIGATIVSLGTTLPEAAVSVFAAIQGRPGLAMGNAVGSMICNASLILGTAAVIRPLLLHKEVIWRQGSLELGAGILLIAASVPFASLDQTFTVGGRLPRAMGVVFLVLLGLYLWLTIKWSKTAHEMEGLAELAEEDALETEAKTGTVAILLKLFAGIALVVASSRILIPMVQETATRLHVPDAVIAATLVAFGTSLPEFVTAVTASRRGHGDLAVGNVIGANILNVLFVAGASAAVTRGGLDVPPQFFKLLFPAMLAIMVVFRVGVWLSGAHLKRSYGVVLLLAYVCVTVLCYRSGM